ncbi:FkbM family methyltransferase [Blastococcus sp. SYSU D01042]
MLGAAERLIGVRAARTAAALTLRIAARRPGSYLRTAHRVSPRLRDESPRLVKIPDRWSEMRPVVRVHRLGLRLELDLRDNLQAILFYTGTYEPAFRRHLLRNLRRGDVVADIGAHIGVHALPTARRLRELGGGTVVAFEPAHDSAAKLRAAASVNALEITLEQAACSDRPGRPALHADPRYSPADAGVRSLHADGPAVGQVRAVRFDDWVAGTPEGSRLARLDVVKLDVEGHEAAALRGMRASLARWRPRAVYVEIKDDSLGRSPTSDADLRALLADLGYHSTGEQFDHDELFVPIVSAPGTGAASAGVDVP